MAVPVSILDSKTAKALGFPDEPTPGDTILPSAIGPVSRFNADGKYNIRRDLPKESRYIMTRTWRWEQWVGRDREEREEECDVYKECYQRDFIAPPSEELVITENESGPLITSRKFNLATSGEESIKHVVNLFLELFGECHVYDSKGIIIPVKTRTVHWKFLPAGSYPWERLKLHIEERTRSSAKVIRDVIIGRQETINGFGPSEYVIGSGGFQDYVAYVFLDREIVVLESIRYGNAIYAFRMDWERFSKLSKAEILSNNFHLERIIHSKKWEQKLSQLLRKESH